MRKILIILIALAFSGSVLALSVEQSARSNCEGFRKAVLAQEGSLEFVVADDQEGTPAGDVDYQLTWPGILPGHILYPIKMLRDRLWIFLTTNPLKKAELYLKLADKRLWSVQILTEEGKSDLAVETATKAEKYLERAINQERLAGEAGEETGPFLERINLASQKHEQVLEGVRERVGGAGEAVVSDLVGYPQRVREQVRERKGDE